MNNLTITKSEDSVLKTRDSKEKVAPLSVNTQGLQSLASGLTEDNLNKRKPLVKNVKFDFLSTGDIGCCHINVDCVTREDMKEALDFARELSTLIPPVKISGSKL